MGQLTGLGIIRMESKWPGKADNVGMGLAARIMPLSAGVSTGQAFSFTRCCKTYDAHQHT